MNNMNKFLAQLRNSIFVLLLVSTANSNAQVLNLNGKNNSVNYQRLAKIDDLINDYIKKNGLKGVQ